MQLVTGRAGTRAWASRLPSDALHHVIMPLLYGCIASPAKFPLHAGVVNSSYWKLAIITTFYVTIALCILLSCFI